MHLAQGARNLGWGDPGTARRATELSRPSFQSGRKMEEEDCPIPMPWAGWAPHAGLWPEGCGPGLESGADGSSYITGQAPNPGLDPGWQASPLLSPLGLPG